MKNAIFFCFFLFAGIEKSNAQNIETVVSDKYVPPVFASGFNASDAVEVIMDLLNQYATLNCANKLGASLKTQLEAAKIKYITIVPKGATAEFLVLTDKFKCTVVGIVFKTQTIRVSDKVCSIQDIKVDQPALIWNPDTTGFFTIKVNF